MDAQKIIDAIGGRKAAMALTGLTKGRISQFITGNHIPRPWLMLFEEKFPSLDWSHLKDETKKSCRAKTQGRKHNRRSTDKNQ
jgi:hypothetical protein